VRRSVDDSSFPVSNEISDTMDEFNYVIVQSIHRIKIISKSLEEEQSSKPKQSIWQGVQQVLVAQQRR
jgi:hypothetical protein